MKQSINWRWLHRTSLLVVTLIPLIVLAISVWSANQYVTAVLHVRCQGTFASLSSHGYGSQLVSFPGYNDVIIRGWLTTGTQAPDIVIITLTSHGANSELALDDALMLAEAGYGTLVIEPRNCADSTQRATTGYYEAADVAGAADYLHSREDIKHVGALGFSAGGTASLLAAADEPGIELIVAMGGYANLRDDILDRHANLGWYAMLIRHMIVWDFTLRGIPTSSISPVDEIAKISPRPVLLIYGEHEAAYGQALYDAAREPKSLWIVLGASHGTYRSADEAGYQERILSFLDDAFQN
nr:prolyl oligopeptidase family serine peptidase [Anaerolineae bacterium]